jgi:demethylmenaquinone methyltransferase/2-methoxy-6-polyprenyl-1,4-benzoquinol methylase
MSSETSLAHYYAQRAQEYERIYQKPERQEDLRTLRTFVDAEFRGADVLEVACGTGYWTEILARTASSVMATDVNDEVLAVAQSKDMDQQRVTFTNADAWALPPFSRKFNAGFAAFWWSHLAKNRVREFLRGFHRALAPGAIVLFMDNMYVDGSSTPISRKDAEGNTYQLRRLNNGSTHEVRKNFPTEAELREVVDGMAAQVEVKFLGYYWLLRYVTSGYYAA